MKQSETHEDLQKSAAKLHLFVSLIEDLQALSGTVPLDELYDALIERTGYVRALETKKTDENLTRIENVQELKTNIVSFMREMPDGTLFDFLNEIALYADIDQYDNNADSVVMMTMHSAKGLEFPTVFIVGAEEGIFPSLRSIGELEEMEEERRLCYVAMTRAKLKLYFTSAQQRMLFGKTTAGKPSRFVDEVNDDYIDKPDAASHEYAYSPDPGELEDRRAGARRVQNRAGAAGGGKQFAGTKQPFAPVRPAASLPDFKKGDAVVHKAFGQGMVTGVQPTGGDALLEVCFDTVGTKRLMAKSAAAYMKKA